MAVSSVAARRLGLAAILTGITGSVLMQTLLATAMPRVVADLGDVQLYGWVFASYLLASTVPLPAFAQLADQVGRRPMFLLGIAGYGAGTALAALAPSMHLLVAARVVQGLGAGALVPAALAAVADLTAGEGKGRLFGLGGVIQVIGTIVGPLIGGFFTDGPGWRWGLVSIVPVTMVAAALAAVGLPASAGRTWTAALRRIDWGQPLRLVQRDADVRRIAGGGFLLGVALMSATAYLPLLVQDVFGRTASDTGVVLIPLMAGVGVGSMLGGQLSSGFGRAGSIGAWAVAAVAFAVLALTAAGHAGLSVAGAAGHAGLSVAGAAAAFAGVGIGTIGPILLVDAQDDAPAGATASLSAMVQLSRNLGGALGTSLLGMLVTGMPVAAGLGWAFLALVATSALGVVFSVAVTRKAQAGPPSRRPRRRSCPPDRR